MGDVSDLCTLVCGHSIHSLRWRATGPYCVECEEALTGQTYSTSAVKSQPVPVKNQSGSEAVWVVDGLKFTEVIRQEHGNCIFSAGMVEGHPVDTMYLKLERDGQVSTFLLLRPDEMAAIGWLATGVLWSHHIQKY